MTSEQHCGLSLFYPGEELTIIHPAQGSLGFEEEFLELTNAEWARLDPRQRALYEEVMLEIQDMVTSLGYSFEVTMSHPKYHHLRAKPNTKSPVWVHFGLPVDENDQVAIENAVICKLCFQKVSTRGGNTSNLGNHLKVHHPLEFRELPSSKDTSLSSRSNADVPPAATSAGAAEPAITVEEIPFKRQKAMLDFQHLDSEASRSCTQAITEYLATGMQPYNIVEHPRFIKMVKTLNPRYQLPSRKYFSNTGVPKLYNDVREKMKRELCRLNERELAIATDSWTSAAGTPFWAVTVHYISDDWKLINACLGCKHFLKDHTADNICEMLTNTFSEWDVDVNKILCSTTDNGANILKAVKQLGFGHISCFAHNINLGVRQALQLTQLKSAVARLKSLQNSISHSWKMRRDLARAQELLKMDKVSLPSACPTRWWSTLKLCQRFLENQLPVFKMLMDYPSKKELILEGCEVSAIQDFVTATSPLENITTTLSGSDYVTASSVLPLCKQIKKLLKPDEGDSGLLQEIKREILGALSEKYESEFMAATLGLASLCDPRFRLRFLEAPEAVRQDAIKQMADLDGSLCAASAEPSTPPAPAVKEGLDRLFDFEEEEEDVAGNGATSLSVLKAERELKDYLAMPRVNFSDCPLTWWKAHEALFPLLKVLTKRFLAIPGTSVPSESVFSTAGNAIKRQRASLLPKNAEMQIFLAKNIEFV